MGRSCGPLVAPCRTHELIQGNAPHAQRAVPHWTRYADRGVIDRRYGEGIVRRKREWGRIASSGVTKELVDRVGLGAFSVSNGLCDWIPFGGACAMWALDYPKYVMCMECGVGQKTVDRWPLSLQ